MGLLVSRTPTLFLRLGEQEREGYVQFDSEGADELKACNEDDRWGAAR